jgi:hypothetical protein
MSSRRIMLRPVRNLRTGSRAAIVWFSTIVMLTSIWHRVTVQGFSDLIRMIANAVLRQGAVLRSNAVVARVTNKTRVHLRSTEYMFADVLKQEICVLRCH